MIPNIVHTVWLGGSSLTNDMSENLYSWNIYFPDCQKFIWISPYDDKSNLGNINGFAIKVLPDNLFIHSNRYIKESTFLFKAYLNKDWAYACDYARFWILKEFGGYYFDTDVEVIKSFNDIFYNDAEVILGYDDIGEKYISTGIMASSKDNRLMQEALNFYESLEYRYDHKNPTSPEVLTSCYNKLLNDKKLSKIYSKNIIRGFSVFTAKNFYNDKIIVNNQTYSIHHFKSSWFSKEKRTKMNRIKLINKLFGYNKFSKFLIKLIG